MKVGALRKGPRNGPWSTSMGTGGVGNTWPKMCPPMLNQMVSFGPKFDATGKSDAAQIRNVITESKKIVKVKLN